MNKELFGINFLVILAFGALLLFLTFSCFVSLLWASRRFFHFLRHSSAVNNTYIHTHTHHHLYTHGLSPRRHIYSLWWPTKNGNFAVSVCIERGIIYIGKLSYGNKFTSILFFEFLFWLLLAAQSLTVSSVHWKWMAVCRLLHLVWVHYGLSMQSSSQPWAMMSRNTVFYWFSGRWISFPKIRFVSHKYGTQRVLIDVFGWRGSCQPFYIDLFFQWSGKKSFRGLSAVSQVATGIISVHLKGTGS